MFKRALLPLCLGWLLSSIASIDAAPVTFQVNMSAQASLGNFDPASDSVFVAGNPLNNWSADASPLTRSTTDADIWTGTYEVEGTAGSTGQYKFVMTTASGTTWEGNVGSGGSTGNRAFTLSDTDQTLPVVYFNNVTNTTSVTAQVTFQVNMAVQISQGKFDPGSGTVYLAGEFNGWSSTGFELTRSTDNPDIWAGTVTLTGTADAIITYKFVMDGSTWEGTVGTGGSQNRALTLKSGAYTLPVVYFSNLEAVPAQVPVTFQVNLAQQTAEGTFDPNVDTVSVAGDLINNWSSTASPLTVSESNSNLWTGTYNIEGLAGTTLYYKFVINGSTWENIDNRMYSLTGTNAQTLPVAMFNTNVKDLGKLTLSAVSGSQVTLSWTASAMAQLQQAASVSGPWEAVPNTLGQSNANVSVSGNIQFFRLATP